MNFDFIIMNGNGVYVWSSFVLVFLVCFLLFIKTRKTLKKLKHLDDIHYIPLYRDYDMNNVARSFTNEINLSDFSDTWKRGFGQG